MASQVELGECHRLGFKHDTGCDSRCHLLFIGLLKNIIEWLGNKTGNSFCIWERSKEKGNELLPQKFAAMGETIMIKFKYVNFKHVNSQATL